MQWWLWGSFSFLCEACRNLSSPSLASGCTQFYLLHLDLVPSFHDALVESQITAREIHVRVSFITALTNTHRHKYVGTSAHIIFFSRRLDEIFDNYSSLVIAISISLFKMENWKQKTEMTCFEPSVQRRGKWSSWEEKYQRKNKRRLVPYS